MNDVALCGCCAGIAPETPVAIGNRPGLSEIAYRIGTWAQFKSSMLAALSESPALAALKTRGDDDFTIALCDAFAIVCDILTFYYERSANEHYLRTATQLVSIAELAALIGYEPSPGVAAGAALAFTIESPPPVTPQVPPPPQPALVPDVVPIAIGTQVQSVPGPGQQPVTFETVAPIAARYDWNALSPQQAVPYAGDPGNCYPQHLRLNGLLGTLSVGDYVLIVVTVGASVSTGINRVTAVSPDATTQSTLVSFENVSGTTAPILQSAPTTSGSTLSGSPDQTTISAQVVNVTWSDQTVFTAQAQKLQWDLDLTQDVINGVTAQGPSSPPLQVFRLSVRAAIFGHNAPYFGTLPSYTPISGGAVPTNWENETLAQLNPSSSGAAIQLDATYPALVVGTWVVLLQGGTTPLVTQVTGATTLSVAKFLLAATVSQLTLNADPSALGAFGMRTTAVFGATDVYTPFAELLDGTTIGGSTIVLNSAQLGLQLGQDVVVTGTSATKTGQTGVELRTIQALALVGGFTQITLDSALDDTYVWNSVRLNANVAPATHGASKSQILGSGDASQAYQRFALNQLPVTYVSAATPTTTASTLVVRVNGEQWNEVPYLYGSGPTDKVFVTQLDTNGNRYVEFGDGAENGARLPTGQNNVVATYRQGLGSAGNVAANQLSTLLTRPLGVRSAINPLAAAGGNDPQTLADAQRSAPIMVRALARIVSLDDFADFAGASAAVAKASAVWAWDGQRQVVCITVSGPNGIAIAPGSSTYLNLVAAIAAAGDGTVPVVLAGYVPRTFTVGATLTVDPSYDLDAVVSSAKAALQSTFAFDARAFMQPVYQSEVVATLQNITGVVALTIESFAFSDGLGVEYSGTSQGALVAGPPRVENGQLIGAELLTIDTGPLPNVVHA